MTTAGSNFISGITTTSFNSTDVVNKDYVDNYVSVPSQTGNEGKFLTTTDGTSTSWDYVSNYQEFTTTGSQTFTVPSYSNLLFIEATGAGGGGNAGQTTAQAGVTWTLRTSRTISDIYKIVYANNSYVVAANSGNILISTDAITWILRTSGTGSALDSLIFGTSPTNTYVTGGSGAAGLILTSTDTIVWTLRTAGTTQLQLRFFYSFDTNTYLYGAFSGAIASSTDAIAWTLRTSGTGSALNALTFGNNIYVAGGGSGVLNTSTDAIVWTRRTSGFGGNISTLYFQYNNYIIAGSSGTLNTSTDAITWTLRTSGTTQGINSLIFGNSVYVAGGGNTATILLTSTDTITWTLRTSNSPTVAIYDINHSNNTFLYVASSGIVATSYSQASGTGGSSGSYTSWYIPKNIISSNLTINPGVGGAGATTDAGTGSAGAGTTVSWTGPGGTYTITASGGRAAGVAGTAQVASQSSFYYTTAGLSGAIQSPIGTGFTATTQTNQFQPTGGGSGAGSTVSAGGSSGTINVYGISTSASGGTSSGTNGSVGIAYTGLPYGSGGGGGGASVSIAATGGNGARGGGGGGGASIGSTFGAGGNGGNGYVKISWW